MKKILTVLMVAATVWFIGSYADVMLTNLNEDASIASWNLFQMFL